MAQDLQARIAEELELPRRRVARVLELLGAGQTVPFVARYRKEATGNLDEGAIRRIAERKEALEALEERRRTVVERIDEQGLLTGELRRRIEACRTRSELEDLYLPYRPRRRTKATIARERGLEPLAERILAQPKEGRPEREAAAFVDRDRGVPDAASALEGARHVVAERVAEDAGVRAIARKAFRRDGRLVAKPAKGARKQRTRFEAYYDYAEPVPRVPSHRYLAVARGEGEGVLRVAVEVEAKRVLPRVEKAMGLARGSPWAGELRAAIEDAWKRLLVPSLTNEIRGELKERADREAVEVFATNLRSRLLASPLGSRPVVAIDPGLRTGCKCVALDATGGFRDHLTVYPAKGEEAARRAGEELVAFVRRHEPAALAVGNGTGGRDVEGLARRALKEAGRSDVLVVQVDEAGASVYSASELARREHPELDVTLRGALSIGRRLQDPLAELVKIDPRSIGAGQYQHDVDQGLLRRKLGEVVEDCVNAVGVELNTASAALLAHVAGIGPTLAERIVARREERGPFRSRRELHDVKGLGPQTFQQCAGFLRVRGGAHPLDDSAVHPERYALVERIAGDLGVRLDELVGHRELAEAIEPDRYVDAGAGDDPARVGRPTLDDIVAELAKPGRDPRADFEPPRFRDDVETPEDLEVGMVLEGVVTNVTAFGAFVDVGVHEDGLVHVSKLARRFVRDPAAVVATGDRLTVRVLDVDLDRRRIALDAREGATAG